MRRVCFRHSFKASYIRISALTMFGAESDLDEALLPNGEFGRSDQGVGVADLGLPGLQRGAGVSSQQHSPIRRLRI